jgi:hypothetical protein
MSFINIIKNRGPRIDPWGTSALIVRHLECALSITTRSLYVIVDNPRESAITLNNDMATIHAWSTKWLVNFNPQKTEMSFINIIKIEALE